MYPLWKISSLNSKSLLQIKIKTNANINTNINTKKSLGRMKPVLLAKFKFGFQSTSYSKLSSSHPKNVKNEIKNEIRAVQKPLESKPIQKTEKSQDKPEDNLNRIEKKIDTKAFPQKIFSTNGYRVFFAEKAQNSAKSPEKRTFEQYKQLLKNVSNLWAAISETEKLMYKQKAISINKERKEEIAKLQNIKLLEPPIKEEKNGIC